jgi:hypothetical protein
MRRKRIFDVGENFYLRNKNGNHHNNGADYDYDPRDPFHPRHTGELPKMELLLADMI